MTSETIKKYQKKSISSLRKTAKEWFHLFIRLRDCDENGYSNCIATGQPLRYGTGHAQAGHYFSAGQYPILEFNEDNVHIQSLADNYFGKQFASYAANLIRKIGIERFNKLNELAAIGKRMNYKHDRFTLIDIIETYKIKVKELSKEKNFRI
jgi:hypothetical protein